mmetsp:Transcript_39734/g.47751  ORF Transcript_39734/g.47751 Transcript_39734/m.47751 type:complete len:182 (-) Transcript_39734:220-765(-)
MKSAQALFLLLNLVASNRLLAHNLIDAPLNRKHVKPNMRKLEDNEGQKHKPPPKHKKNSSGSSGTTDSTSSGSTDSTSSGSTDSDSSNNAGPNLKHGGASLIAVGAVAIGTAASALFFRQRQRRVIDPNSDKTHPLTGVLSRRIKTFHHLTMDTRNINRKDLHEMTIEAGGSRLPMEPHLV